MEEFPFKLFMSNLSSSRLLNIDLVDKDKWGCTCVLFIQPHQGIPYILNNKYFNGIGSSLTKILSLSPCAQDSRRRIKSMIERSYLTFWPVRVSMPQIAYYSWPNNLQFARESMLVPGSICHSSTTTLGLAVHGWMPEASTNCWDTCLLRAS